MHVYTYIYFLLFILIFILIEIEIELFKQQVYIFIFFMYLSLPYNATSKRYSDYFQLSAFNHDLVAEWIHFALFGIILPTTKGKVCTFWGL